MNVVLLISCMHQADTSIIDRTNVQSDVVIINQCDRNSIEEFDFINKIGQACHAKFICTTDRGLSRSRNMAIKNTSGDLCIISDDDERFEDDYVEKILDAYKKQQDADFISFACIREGHNYPEIWCRMGIMRILKTSSIQITFKKESIISNNIQFDIKMGSGTGNGSGEENKFMMDCKRAGLRMYYCPSIITKLLSTNSLWLNGFDEKYFRNRGWSSRRILGTSLGLLFIWYNIFSHCKDFISKEYSLFRIIKCFHKGFFEKR